MMNKPASKESSRTWAPLVAITLVGLLLRIYGLGNHSFWYDEGATLWFAMGPTARWISDTHPPLYYALAHFWLQFGHSEFWLRLLSAIPGAATIPLVYSLGKKLFGHRSGLLAAAFMALLAFHIDHSQQARMYALFVFLYGCAVWALLCATREGKRRHWITFAIVGILLAYVQGIGIFYVAIVGTLYPILSPHPLNRKSWQPFLIANFIIGLSYLPWLWLLSQSHFRVGFLGWLARPTLANVAGTLVTFLGRYIPVDFFGPAGSPLHALKYVAIAILMSPTLALLWIAVRQILRRQDWWAGVTAMAVFAVPILFLFIFSSFLTPIYLDRVVLPAAIGLALLLGASLKDRESSKPHLKYVVATALLFASLNTFFFLRAQLIEDFHGLSSDLQQSVRPGDWIFFSSDSGFPRFLVEFYDPENTLGNARKLDLQDSLYHCRESIDKCLGKHTEELKKAPRVWIVYSHDTSSRDHKAIQEWLDAHFRPVYFKVYEQTLKLTETRPVGF